MKAQGDVARYKGFASKIYSVIENTLKQGIADKVDWNREVFLSDKGGFLPSTQLYYCDDNELKDFFASKVEIIWLPFHWDNVKGMLDAGGFKHLSQSISITKKFDSLKEIDGDQINQLLQRMSYVRNYLGKKKYELLAEFQKAGVLKRIDNLEVFETPNIILDYMLQIEGSEPVTVENVEREAYFSIEENRLYKSAQTALMSTPVANELSKYFAPIKDEVFLLLDSLFNASEEEIDKKLEHFGIRDSFDATESIASAVTLITSGGEQATIEESKQGEVEETLPQGDIARKPAMPPSTQPTRDLIEPNDFIFNEDVEMHNPYIKTDGASASVSTRKIKLKKGLLGNKDGKRMTKLLGGRLDTQDFAIEFVMRLEENEGRDPEDRHDQYRIGYDVYSKDTENGEVFIEVKSFKGDAGSWELTPYEWKKAEEEKDKYFVYVVSRLSEGSIPIIEIVQNPAKYLTPDPPIKKIFSDWKNGVLKVVKLQKI